LRDALIYAIARDQKYLGTIFEPPFDRHVGWTDLLRRKLNRGTTGILASFGGPVPALASDFQALYIACWIYRPVEKGSFMISLHGHWLRGIMQAFERMNFRWSSHLSRTARSAGEEYRFLKGYSELLVQVETDAGTGVPYLFLKTEGHGAFSLAHLSSFHTKMTSADGRGNVQNAALHHFATQGELGITAAAGENYSKDYEAVLRNLKIGGLVATADEVIPAIVEKLQSKAVLANPHVWQRWQHQRATSASAQLSAGLSARNVLLADLITMVILPTIAQPNVDNAKHQFLGVLRAAQRTLARLAGNLREDAARFGGEYMPRVFEEVRVTPDLLDRSLNDFRDALAGEIAAFG
jgi:hypothetical protein